MSIICENCKRSFRTWGIRKSCPYCLHIIGEEPYDYKPRPSLFCPDCHMVLSGGGHRHICPSRPEDPVFGAATATMLNPTDLLVAGSGASIIGSIQPTTPTAPTPETPPTTDYSPSGSDYSSSGSDPSNSGSDSSSSGGDSSGS